LAIDPMKRLPSPAKCSHAILTTFRSLYVWPRPVWNKREGEIGSTQNSRCSILVSNYYSIPHPDPAVFGLLDQLLRGFDAALRFWLSTVVVPQGSRVGVVDLYTASLGRTGLVMLERRNGDNGGFDFDPHPTTLGHELIARELERAWTTLSGN
jgi:hypothetical protein